VSRFYLVMIGLGVGTFLIRSSVILVSDRIKLTNDMKRLFSFIPAAILPALIMPLVFFHEGVVDLVGGKERLIVTFFVLLISFKIKKMSVSIFSGLFLLYLLRVYL